MGARLPEVAPARAPLGAAQPASVRRMPAETGSLGRSVRELQQFAQSFQEERRKREDARAIVDVQEQANAFREQALQETDPNVLEQMFAEGLPRIQAQVEAQFRDNPRVGLAARSILDRTRAALVGYRMSVRRRDALVTADRASSAFAADVSQIPLDQGELQGEALAQLRDTVGALEGLSPVEQERVVEQASRRGAYAFLGSQIDADPARALALLNDPGRLRQDPLLRNLEPRDLTTLRSAAQTEERRVRMLQRQQQKDAEEAATDAWLPRIFGPLGDTPRTDEILADPALSAATKEHLIGLVEKRTTGKSLDTTNEVLANELYRRIHDRNAADPITSFQEVVPYVGNGLSREDAEAFREDLKQIQASPEIKRKDQLFAEFLRNVKSQLDDSTLLVNDPVGARKFWMFRMEARRRWQAALEAGEDPVAKLLAPDSPDYLGRMVVLYTPSMEESLQAQMELLSPRPATEPLPQHRENETPEQYLQRVHP